MSEDDTAKLLSDELVEICKSDSLSEEGLRDIIERYGVTSNNSLHDESNFNYDFFIDACGNVNVTEAMIRYLIEYFPNAPRVVSVYGDADMEFWGETPLHLACMNSSTSLQIIQLLIEAAPDCDRYEGSDGNLPIHDLCHNYIKKAEIEMLMVLFDKYPESIRYTDAYGTLPLHNAACERSTEFCRRLVELYPESERIGSGDGSLPLHHACLKNTLPAVEYFYNLYPDAINHVTTFGHYPIHHALQENVGRSNDAASVDIVKFLLQLPGVRHQKFGGKSLLHFACMQSQHYNDLTIEAVIQKLKIIFDDNPSSIMDVANIRYRHKKVRAFIKGEMVYARQARDHRQMMRPDENGQLPLHRALRNNVMLGSIKLLLKGNRSAARSADNNGSFPLHLACQHHDSPLVIKHLIDFCPTTLRHVDFDQDNVLHYACRGVKYETIAMLLDRYNAGLVSMRNANNELPIDLLFKSNSVEDGESEEYTDCVFRLLRAYPETLV